jgi:hypothetical protein
MRISGLIDDLRRGIASKLVTAQRRNDFVCGDCERSERCALPPNDNCIIRAEQIARGDWKARRRARTLTQLGM